MLCWLGILAEEARAEGRQRRAEIWRTTFNSFSRFLGGKDIGLRQMEGRLMQRYENCLLAGGLCPNTTSFYLRNLRSAYSKAVKAKLCPAPRQNPFSEVYTGVAKTRKRAVCADTLRAIRKLDLDGRPDLDYARNLFLLSFYTRGMAFADMAGLRRSDLKEGILCYVRRKTGRPLFIHWEERMQETVEAMLVILRKGGFGTGGVNFDAKIRRNSTDVEDLFIAHITGMDTFAHALIIADEILKNSSLEAWRAQRYASFDAGKGAEFEQGKLTLENLRDYAASAGEPATLSGKQEKYEQLLTMYM